MPGEAKSSLIISQAGSVPLLYLSAKLTSEEWKAALRWAGETQNKSESNKKINMDISMATQEGS